MKLRDLLFFFLLFLTVGVSLIVSIGISAKLVSWLDRQRKEDQERLFGTLGGYQ